MRPLSFIVPLLCSLCPFSASANCPAAAPSGVVIVGNARFTVVTPQLIRLEYASGGSFVDERSIFAIGRGVRCIDYTQTHVGNVTMIDTGVIRLRFTDDGQPFNANNLSADIRESENHSVTWLPGASNPGNLGGTARTLDGWNGSRELPPGLLSRDGWFLLDDSDSPLLTSDWVRSRPGTNSTDWYLFGYGSDYRAALRSLAAIGGPVPMPRRSVLGAWYSRYWPYSSDDYRQIVRQYAEHDFPLDVIVMDMDWHRAGWTGFSWNRQLLPDAEALLKWFHQQRLDVTLNDHPADGVQPGEDAYAQFTRDMGLSPASRTVIPFDAGNQKYMQTFYRDTHVPLQREGVDFWWLDWQQYPFTRSVPDLSNLFWLNAFYYQQTSADGRRGQDLSRWGGWGSHRYPIQFSGDTSSNWVMLAAEVPFTSTAGNAGAFFWSHDVGGHMGPRIEESYARWAQFGATSAALRSHSTRNADLDRRPWTYPKWVEDSIRTSFHLRSELFPYIYSSVWQTCHDTVPLNRPLYVDEPKAPEAYQNPQAYLYGDNLLVAPITSPGFGESRLASQAVWFPPGDWYDFFTGEHYAGPQEAVASADIDAFPLFARGGIPIPMQPYTSRMTSTPLNTLVVRCFPGRDGQTHTFALHEDDGLTTQYEKGRFATTALTAETRRGQLSIRIAAVNGHFDGQPMRRAYVIELPSTKKATAATVDGASAAVEYDGITCTNRIHVGQRPIEQATDIVVSVEPADDELLKARGIAHRAGLRADRFVGKPLKAALGEALEATSPDGVKLLLTAADVAFVERNTTVYGFPGSTTPYFAAAPGLIDPGSFRWTTPSPTGPTSDIVRSIDGVTPVSADAIPGKIDDPLAYAPTRRVASFTVDGHPVKVSSPVVRRDFSGVTQNVARSARATASSSEYGYGPGAAIDGIIGGYPDAPEHEWASTQTTGAWLTLTWDQPQTIDRIWLYDRPNPTDQVTAGEIKFDDGSALPVGPLPDDAGTPAVLRFPKKTVRSLSFTVTAVTPATYRSGLSEIVVWKATEDPATKTK